MLRQHTDCLERIFSLTYYMDKSDIIKVLIPILELRNELPKRKKGTSGKSVMANMITAFFGKGIDSREI